MNCENIKEFIKNSWEETVRTHTQDKDDLIGLPYPYTVPCRDGYFQEMYYWDTYFANKGLLLSGRVENAKFNCDNLRFMLRKYGFVPNGNRTRYLMGSQPPYLSLMVYDVYLKTGDKQWLKGAYEDLLKEYEFWQTKRVTPTGLNRYYTMATGAWCSSYVDYARSRTKLPLLGDPEKVGADYRAEGESGWDFTKRFDSVCGDCNPVDLNCNLYAYEKLFGFYERELGVSSRDWSAVSAARKALMDKYLFDKERKIYNDYNYVTGKLSETISCASFQPYFVGLTSNGKGVETLLKALETPYGLVATDYKDGHFQWGYPNGWAPLHLIAAFGLKQAGAKEDGMRIAKKYCETVERCFVSSGHLFEKYNMTTGGSDTLDEYELPHMLGWSAGVFLALLDLLENE